MQNKQKTKEGMELNKIMDVKEPEREWMRCCTTRDLVSFMQKWGRSLCRCEVSV